MRVEIVVPPGVDVIPRLQLIFLDLVRQNSDHCSAAVVRVTDSQPPAPPSFTHPHALSFPIDATFNRLYIAYWLLIVTSLLTIFHFPFLFASKTISRSLADTRAYSNFF